MWAWHVKMATQNLLKLLVMRNSLLGDVCCCEVVKSFSRLESNSLTFPQLVKAFKPRQVAMLVTNSACHSCLVNLMSVNDANCLMMSQQLKMPTQNLLRLLLLLVLMMRIGIATVCCRLGSWGLIIKLSFCSDFEHKVLSRYEDESCPRFES